MITTVVPPTGRVLDGDLAAHGFDEALRDGETEADAVVGGSSSVAEALERLEHRLALVSWDAGTAVDDADVDAPSEPSRFDAHRWSLRAPS